MALATKLCPGCKLTKKVTEFGKDRSSPDGFYTYCLECDRKKQRESYQRRNGGKEGSYLGSH